MKAKIDKKITGFKVKTEDTLKTEKVETKQPDIPVERDPILRGKTYKFKPSNGNHSFYITVNDQLISGQWKPFEIFINTKSVEHFEYMQTITRLVSAIFRKCDDISFMVEELKEIYSPLGGYWGKSLVKGKQTYFNSIMNQIGDIIEYHTKTLSISENIKEAPLLEETDNSVEGAECPECKQMTLVMQGGCPTCSNCGYSKCS